MNNGEFRKLIKIVEFNELPQEPEIVYAVINVNCHWEIGDINNPGPTHVQDPFGLKGNYQSLFKQPGPNDGPIIKSFLKKVMALAKYQGFGLNYADGLPFGSDELGLQYDTVGRGKESLSRLYQAGKELEESIFEVVEDYEDRLEIDEVVILHELHLLLDDKTTQIVHEPEIEMLAKGQMTLRDTDAFEYRQEGWGNFKDPGPSKGV